MGLFRIIVDVSLSAEGVFSRSVRGQCESLTTQRTLIPPILSLSFTVSRPGAVRIPCLALWSHFAIPGESPSEVPYRTLAIPHSQMDVERSFTHCTQQSRKLIWTRSEGAKCQQDQHGAWHRPKLVQRRWHLTLGMLGMKSAVL